MKKLRMPIVSGQFYDSNEAKLKQTIKKSFLDTRGPKSLPQIKNGNKKIKGIIVPHAGYIYSGAIAAHSYHILADNRFADTFIIIGPNHTGMGSRVSVMMEGVWQTPLGTIQINENLAKQVRRGIIDLDETAHLYEHSIEVQLPFLQFIAKKKNINFIPICMRMQDIETSTEVGNTIADAIKQIDERIVIIASSDFSHVGFNYINTPPANTNVDEYTKIQDELAINKILDLDPEGLIDTVHKNKITICGYGPVAAMLIASKILGANYVELLKYGTSYEVYPSNSCVGYGAFAIY